MTPIPNADFYGSRVESFRYDLLDLRNQKVDELQVSTAVSGSLDFSTQANPQGSGSATITPKTPINWLQQRVRVWYLTDGGAANAGNTLSDYLIERAEQYQPVVEMPTGAAVEVVFLDGTFIRN